MNNSILYNKYLLLLIFGFLAFCGYFIFFWDPVSVDKIERFTEQRAVLATGINFDTKKLVVVNAENGQLAQRCLPVTTSKVNNQVSETIFDSTQHNAKNKGIPVCDVEIITDSNPELAAALELSKKTIEGLIKRDNTFVKAHFVVEIKGVYPGSHCNVTSSGGYQYQTCSRKR